MAEQQRYSEALSICQHLLQDYPLREEIWRRVMQCYANSGQREQALRAYEQCQALLQRELEADPLAETQAVYEAILQNKQGCPQLTKDLTPQPLSVYGEGCRRRGEVESPELQTLSELSAAVGTSRAVLALENIADVDIATLYTLCHWVHLVPRADLLIVGTQDRAEDLTGFWIRERTR